MNTLNKFLLSVGMCFVLGNATAQIEGTVYRDLNVSKSRDTANPYEPLAVGVIVNVYNNANAIIASYKSTAGTGTPAMGPNVEIPATGTAYNGTQGSNTGRVPSGTKVK